MKVGVQCLLLWCQLREELLTHERRKVALLHLPGDAPNTDLTVVDTRLDVVIGRVFLIPFISVFGYRLDLGFQLFIRILAAV